MTRVHDMGGRFGDGAVEPKESEPVFKEDWHARALAVTLAAGSLGQWNLDISRHARERLSPKDYARFSYYEKWMAGLANLLVERGVLTRDELRSGQPAGPSALADRAMKAEAVAGVLATGGPSLRESNAGPKFATGDRVQSLPIAENTRVSGGHTRLPAYAAGAMGLILRCHGAHVLPDCNAHGLGEQPEPLYAVAFRAADLFRHPEHPEDEVILDMWESYLVPA